MRCGGLGTKKLAMCMQEQGFLQRWIVNDSVADPHSHGFGGVEDCLWNGIINFRVQHEVGDIGNEHGEMIYHRLHVYKENYTVYTNYRVSGCP